MTNKLKIAEQALRIIVGGHPTGDAEVSLRELIVFVSQAFATVVARKFFEGKNEGEALINGNFIYPFEDVAVLKDSAKGLFYSIVPSTGVTLPYDMEIHQVSRMKDQTDAFLPVPNGFLDLYEGLEAGRLENRIGYFVENGRIYFVGMNTLNKVDTVLLKIVAPIGSIDDEDDINISEDIQLEIVIKAVELYKIQQVSPKDTINDLNK